MIPIMTSVARMTQHQAVGTSSAAVAGTGASGCLSYGSAGAVDLVAAASIACTAMLTSRAGARATTLFNPVQMARAFAIFQMVVAPMVPLKGLLVGQKKAESREGLGSATEDGGAAQGEPVADSHDRSTQLLQLAATGCIAGFASGLFGIGGGVIITPALCLLSDMPYACVLGTTLASMVPPSLVSATTHHSLGNIVVSAVVPIIAGSALGAFVSAQVAVRAPEELLQWTFAFFIFSQGALKYRSLYGRV